MKTFLFLLMLSAAFVQAQSLTATITDDIKMELTKSKGTVLLKAGTTVDVVSKEGDALTVVYRKIQGRVPVAKTDFKGDAAEALAEAPKADAKPAAPAPANPAVQAKAADPKAAAPTSRDAPTTNYGKMVRKARDNEAKNKETLVDPVNEVSGAGKK